LTTSNWTTPVGADRAVIAAHQEGANRGDILKRIPAVTAELQHAAVEAQIGIRFRCFKIEVLPERQTWKATLEEIKPE
jgi:hypothetical protein